MIDPAALSAMHAAEPGARLSFVLSWTARPDLPAIAALPTREARIAAVQAAYAAIKADAAGELADSGVETLSDIRGTSMMVASAAAEAWQRLLGSLSTRADLTVLPNEIVHAGSHPS